MTDATIRDAKIADAEFIHDLFQPFGAVSVRRMFGGAGLFADGVMFGLVSGGQIYLKADESTVTCFEREQCGPFEYSTKNGKRHRTGGCPTGSTTTPTSSRNGPGKRSLPRAKVRRQSRGPERSG
jgi:hypothetical protein